MNQLGIVNIVAPSEQWLETIYPKWITRSAIRFSLVFWLADSHTRPSESYPLPCPEPPDARGEFVHLANVHHPDNWRRKTSCNKPVTAPDTKRVINLNFKDSPYWNMDLPEKEKAEAKWWQVWKE